MKILIGSDTYPPDVNGNSYAAYRLANSLAQNGHRVYVVVPSTKFSDQIVSKDGIKEYRVKSIPLLVYPKLRFCPPLIARGFIRQAVLEIKPDIIHIQNHYVIGRYLAKEAQKYSIPIVGTNHFMPENQLHHLPILKLAKKRTKKYFWKLFLDVYQTVDMVTTPTRAAANQIHKIGFKGKVLVISNGIDLGRFNKVNKGDYLKKRYHLPENLPIVLYVGRLDKEKSVDTLIRAAKIAGKTTAVHLVIVGSGKEKERLKLLARTSGLSRFITFTGFVPDKDLPNIYKIADIFVMPGTAELQSITTMEAMASGLPVLAAKAVALPELVKEGANGFLFPPYNAKILASRIINLVQNEPLRLRMGKNSLKFIQDHDMQKVLKEYERLYQLAINQHKQLSVRVYDQKRSLRSYLKSIISD